MKKPSNDDIPEAEMVMAEAIAFEAQVEKENERFSKMTPAQKRVRIAEDVILWLRAKRIKPASVYLSLDGYTGHDEPLPDKVDGIQCTACALGSIFAAAAERGLCSINAHARYIPCASDMRDRLSPYFSKDQLLLIEDSFEGSAYRLYSWFAKSLRDSWRAATMVAIMLNIIDNGGTFKPSKFRPRVDGPRAYRALEGK